MTCTHCDSITATYRDLVGYGMVAVDPQHQGSPASLPVNRWPVKEVLACDCRCHDIWKTWRPR